MLLLVGSRALNYHGFFPQHKGTQDWDFFGTHEDAVLLFKTLRDNFEFTTTKQTNSGWIVKVRKSETEAYTFIEIHVINDDSGMFVDKYGDNEIYSLSDDYWSWEKHPFNPLQQIRVVTPDVVLAMKLSHKFKDDVHFAKTRTDILWLQDCGEKLTPFLQRLSEQRAERTYHKKYNLNVSKDEFFTNNVKYKYDHDSLHQAVKRNDKPAYMYFQKDGSEVMCDRSKFEALPFEIKLNAVCEESSVLALERAVVPFGADPVRAYQRALRSVCTGVTSGWFRDFAWQNYDKALESMWDYVSDFKSGVESGLVQLHRN